MQNRLLGVETEYSITAFGSGKNRPARQEVLRLWLAAAQGKLKHLPDTGSGMFLENGSRLYIDCGLHPEFSTPECSSPGEVLRYIHAGERILAELTNAVQAQLSGSAEVSLFRCNVDYGGTGSTWGCHESYLHTADPRHVARQIIPHLVSRLIYTGAGGFNSFCPGVEFTLSPRVPHLCQVVSADSTTNRGIFHTKDESLSCQGYHRLHVIVGESLNSETATWLKLATTALVVAMADGGVLPGEEVQIRSPLDAMRKFARDPECSALAELADGRRWRAIDIQRHYLEHAERNLHQGFMPPWAAETCAAWRDMLDRLENAPGSVAGSLDWSTKLSLYKDRAHRRGLSWESLQHWSRIMAELKAAQRLAGCQDHPLSVEFVLSAASPIGDVVRKLRPLLREHDLHWDGLASFLNLRLELFEIDTRFGRVGQGSIFQSLDDAGVLHHRIAKSESADAAVSDPPPAGRARLRSRLIRQLAGNGMRYRCNWDCIWDTRELRKLDLSDPFETQERWSDAPPAGAPEHFVLQELIGSIRRRVVR